MIDRLKGLTEDGAKLNLSRLTQCIAELFPMAIGESVEQSGAGAAVVHSAIDWQQLGELMGLEIQVKALNAAESSGSGGAGGGFEPFGFSWQGKRAAVREANAVIDLALRPCREESLDWDTTSNLYLKGDNLEVLKLLQGSYLGQVKMIYIDPPYNTGNDSFVYADNFAQSRKEFERDAGLIDEATGSRLMTNREGSAHFHSAWCSMMCSRLMMARSLLRSDGVIFISIDDNEQHHLRSMCDEIFGEQNFVAQFVWQRAFSPKNDAHLVATSHEYVLMYARKREDFAIGRLPRTARHNAKYTNPDHDPRGPWNSCDLSAPSYNKAYDYPITDPNGRVLLPPKGSCWRVSQKRYAELLADNRIVFSKDGKVPKLKKFLSELKHEGIVPTSILQDSVLGKEDEVDSVLYDELGKCVSPTQMVALFDVLRQLSKHQNKNKASTINNFLRGVEEEAESFASTSMLYHEKVGHSSDGTRALKRLLDAGVFDGPKPVRLIRHLMTLANLDPHAGDIVLDFFSGSATTAEAVMSANTEDGGNRRFILVQFPEVCAKDTPAAQAGYHNICEIGLERIRRAGALLCPKDSVSQVDTVTSFTNPDPTLDGDFSAPKEGDTHTKMVHGGGYGSFSKLWCCTKRKYIRSSGLW